MSYHLISEDVLIAGAGPIGIMAAAVARHVGARHVVSTEVMGGRITMLGMPPGKSPVDWSRIVFKAITLMDV